MKHLLRIYFLIVVQSIAAQPVDTRAVLNLQGNFTTLSVCPDGNVWIATLMGEIYHSRNSGTDWHYAPLPYNSNRFTSFSNLHFFDAQHAIMIRENDQVLVTSDTAETWQVTRPEGEMFLDIAVDPSGKAWISGNKSICYSADFGNSWSTIPLPIPAVDTYNNITMSGTQKGLLYGNSRYIYITDNNWKTNKRIKVPQLNKDELEPLQALIWNDRMVIRFDDTVYFSKWGKNDWKPANLKIRMLLPNGNGELYALSQDNQLIQFNSENEFKVIADKLPKAVYAFSGQTLLGADADFFYRFEKGTLSVNPYYTSDHRIPEPYKTADGNPISWGSDGKHLYVCQSNDRNWQRTEILPFNVWEIKQLPDSSAILWDGEAHHRYDLSTHHLSNYKPENPLKEFLRVPLKSFSITTTSTGCSHYSMDSIVYTKTMDSLFCSQRLFEVDNNRSRTSNCSLTFPVKKIEMILETLNAGYDKPLFLQEFNISEEDRRLYLENAHTKSVYARCSKQERKALSDYYAAFAERTDQTDVKPFFKGTPIISTSMESITVRFINENDEELLVSNTDLYHAVPWHLPWLVHYDGFSYKTGDVAFSRFVDSCTPKGFMGKNAFNNPDLLMELADFFHSKSNPSPYQTGKE